MLLLLLFILRIRAVTSIINVGRGGSIYTLILRNHSINDGLYDQGCNVKPKHQIGEAITFTLDFYCLEWLQGVFKVNLQIGLAQIQYNDI